jgi:creatinine amidohydrolase/Fe(II)-dependent formamide hydrolase-like protein
MDYWTSFSKSGVSGDPLLATAKKGKIMFDAVVDGFLGLVKEFKVRQRGERTDWHREHWKPHVQP